MSVYVELNGSQTSFNTDKGWVILSPIEQSIKEKIERIGTPLKEWDINIYRGILTGYNDAFIINGEKKDELIAADPKSAEIIRPILRGRDIKRYGYDFADLWLITTFPSQHYNIENYPAIKKHLLSYGIERLEQSGKTYTVNGQTIKSRKKTNNQWFETQDSIKYTDDFSKQKIVWGELSDEPKFALDAYGQFTPLNTVFMMTGNHLEYLLSFLNSPVSKYFFSTNIATTSGVGTIRWLKYTIETLPIPIPDERILDEITPLIKFIGYENTTQMNKLNFIVYSLYGFTAEEIEFIENFDVS